MGVLQKLKTAARRKPSEADVHIGGVLHTLTEAPEEETRAFAEQVCRHMGDRLQGRDSFSSFMGMGLGLTIQGPGMAIRGEKAEYVVGPGDGNVVVYSDDGEVLTEIKGLSFPGWE